MTNLVCDFCAAQNPPWRFPATNFYNPETNAESTGGWLACEVCAALVLAGHWETLAQRSTLNPAIKKMLVELGPEYAQVIIAWARRFHQQFREHRTGEPVRV